MWVIIQRKKDESSRYKQPAPLAPFQCLSYLLYTIVKTLSSIIKLSPRKKYLLKKGKNVKWFRYRPGVAQRVGRGIALLFHDRGTRRRWVVSSTPGPHFTRGKDPVPILQEAGWTPGPVWTGGNSRPHRDSIPDRPARSQSLYRLSYPAHKNKSYTYGYWCQKVNVEKYVFTKQRRNTYASSQRDISK